MILADDSSLEYRVAAVALDADHGDEIAYTIDQIQDHIGSSLTLAQQVLLRRELEQLVQRALVIRSIRHPRRTQGWP